MSTSELFKEKFQIKHLQETYNSKIAHKANLGLDRINRKAFENKLEEHLEVISRKALEGSYNFTLYKEKLLSKGKGKYPRVLSIPTIRDKITLSVINEILTAAYSEKIEVKLTQSIIEEIKSAVRSGGFNYFIKIDIKNFYDNIDHDILINKIKKKIKKTEVIELITKAIKTPTVVEGKRNSSPEILKVGVPQGISISNILANIYLLDLDKKFKEQKGIKYFRYVDDILILCTTSNSKQIGKSIKNQLCNKLLLSLNDKNTEGELIKGFDYLGYHYTKLKGDYYGFTVRSGNLLKLESSLINTFTEYKGSKNSQKFIWGLNNRITGFVLDERKYGWLFFYSQIDNVAILYHLDWFVQKMCKIYNVRPALRKRIKKFVKAYFEIIKRRAKSGYIPNSKEFSIKEQKRTLQYIFDYSKSELDKLSDQAIELIFKRELYRSVRELEKDVQFFS